MRAKLHKMKVLNIFSGAIINLDPKKDKENTCLYEKFNEDAYIEMIQHLNQEVLALALQKRFYQLPAVEMQNAPAKLASKLHLFHV